MKKESYYIKMYTCLKGDSLLCFSSFYSTRINSGVVFFFLLLLSCSHPEIETDNKKTKPTEAIELVAFTDTLTPPVVTLLNSRPAPKVISVTGDSSVTSLLRTDSEKIILLSPPEVLQANFAVPMVNYSAEQGLFSSILKILRDKKGNIWFGTDGGGVTRYDGKSFTNFNTSNGLQSNSITSIMEDKKGNFWFGSYRAGVSRYDGKSFIKYNNVNGLRNMSITCIVEDKNGKIWFGTNGQGACCYDGTSFTSFTSKQGLSGNSVTCILEDKKGILWFGTEGNGVSSFDGKTFSKLKTENWLSHITLLSMAEDKSGNLWFGTSNKGAIRFDGEKFTTFNTSKGLCNNTILCIAEGDNGGDLWFGTIEGVSRFDGKSFTSFSKAQGLINGVIQDIAKDNSGNLWFGSFGGGASRCNVKTLMYYQTIGSGPVLSVAEDTSGNKWFSSYQGGITRFDGKTYTTYSKPQGLIGGVNQITVDKNNNLWLGTNGYGVRCFDGKSFTTYTTKQGLGNNNISCIIEDKNGALWFGTYDGGVSRFDGKTFTTYTTSQGLASNTIYCMAEDNNGNLWFGTACCGVSCFNGKTFTTYTSAQGLGSNILFSILPDHEGNLWFGTDGGGVSRFDGKTFTSYTNSQGLGDNNVWGVVQDRSGMIWFGTNEGISVLKGFESLTSQDKREKKRSSKQLTAQNNVSNADLSEGFTPVFETFNFKNGYQIKDIYLGTLLVDRKGIVWGGTGDKLLRFDYSGVVKNLDTPDVVINSIKIGGEKICWNNLYNRANKEKKTAKKKSNSKLSVEDSLAMINEEEITFGGVLSPHIREGMNQKFHGIYFDSITRFNPIPINLVLPFSHNSISFDFAAVEPARPYLVDYQYILVGYDHNWNPITNNTSANFGNIQEGTYTFKLKARSPDGVWSNTLTYTFRVLPPFYRTWWAYLIYLILGGLLIYSLLRWRTFRLEKDKTRLEKVVKQRTAELMEEKSEVEKQKNRSDALLLNILPEDIAAELKDKGSSDARHYENVTVIMTDFVNFTRISEQMSPQTLIDELHTCFKAFDEITEKYNIEKIKTIGDAYLAVAGLPNADALHAQKVVQAARDIILFMEERHRQFNDGTFKIRIGIHSGSVVAGIVGVKKFAYDIWGDTVNTAARMEQKSEAGKINISHATYLLVKDNFECLYRGEIDAKNKGMMKMYYVNHSFSQSKSF